MKGKINTDKGTMIVEFYEKDAPKTVQNFIGLAKQGYYNGLNFHRVIPNFVAQGKVTEGLEIVEQIQQGDKFSVEIMD